MIIYVCKNKVSEEVSMDFYEILMQKGKKEGIEKMS